MTEAPHAASDGARPSYATALSDHTFLWRIDAAADMTGGYVDQNDLARLLKNPTKATARDCLVSQIVYWLQAGTETRGGYDDLVKQYPRLAEIRARYAP